MQAELESKFNITELREEKENEINDLVARLDALKGDISGYEIKVESLTSAKNNFEEVKKDLSDNLKTNQKAAKKKREVLSELNKLGG